ncbi:zeta toxin family protein [Actinomyces trachealis]|uniref:zeta toxin family protein n=1 Tax=Actinomyces trachealis TaxID=2763540 RepID=UPI0018C84297|nr:zeta toxin family protein [Actinomyces trachealis]
MTPAGWRTSGRSVAILLAGSPGSGKSTSLGEVFSRGDDEVTGGRPREAFTVIDADEVKGRLIEQARCDGSLESFIKPGVVRDLEAVGEVFSDLDLASLVHEESSMIARKVRIRAVSERRDLVVDQVCSSPRKTAELVDELVASGYRVSVVEINATREFSLESTFGRYVAVAADGGQARRVPTEVVENVFDTDGSSRPRQSVEALLCREPCPVAAWRRYDAIVPGAPLVLTQQGSRGSDGVMRRVAPQPLQAPRRRSKTDVLAGRDERARQLLERSRRLPDAARRRPDLGR